MSSARWMLPLSIAALSAGSAWSAPGDGLKGPSADDPLWSRWQGRLSVVASPATRWSTDAFSSGESGLRPTGFSLMGDYVFAQSLSASGQARAFRATSGLVVGPRSALWIGSPASTPAAFSVDRRNASALAGPYGADPGDGLALPYVGVGYSGLNTRAGWGFSADFGLIAMGGGSTVKLGRMFGGSQSLDELLRDMRLSPVLQLGVSYSF